MKKFTIPCEFGGQKAPFGIYIGKPDNGLHPLQFQQEWLQEVRGGNIPLEVMNTFQKLQNIAIENDVDYEELCVYAFGEAAAEKKAENEKAMEDSENKDQE